MIKQTGEHRPVSLTPEYRIYTSAKVRCEGRTAKHYRNYKARGIKFKFQSFKEFIDDIGWRPSSEYSLDRINNDGNYESGNVKWSTLSENNRNQRKRSVIENFTTEELLKELERRQFIQYY